MYKSYDCLILFQESSATTCKEGAPGTPHQAASQSGQLNQDTPEEGHQKDPMTSSPAERWVTTTGQLLRRER
jgi:hypothetical protein